MVASNHERGIAHAVTGKLHSGFALFAIVQRNAVFIKPLDHKVTQFAAIFFSVQGLTWTFSMM
jgi:hypothetical protein